MGYLYLSSYINISSLFSIDYSEIKLNIIIIIIIKHNFNDTKCKFFKEVLHIKKLQMFVSWSCLVF